MVRGAGIDDLFDDLPQLVYFYREDPFINVLIVRFSDRGAKGLINFFYAMSKEVLKTDDERERHTAITRLVDHIHEVDCLALHPIRHDLDVADRVNCEVTGSPPVNVV